MIHNGNTKRSLGYRFLLVVILSFSLLGAAQAFQVPTGVQDLNLTLNTTVLYNLGLRVDPIDPSIQNSPGYYERDSKFGQWDSIASRRTIQPNLSLVYRPDFNEYYGAIVSGDAWYDPAYSDTDVPVPRGRTRSSYNNNKYSNHTARYYRGPSA